MIDLWHADEKGEYDNTSFRYRGHVITGADGSFRFRTIVPAVYSGRTRHYHVKVQAPGSRLLTTQLYFPNEPANLRDGLFQRELLMRVRTPATVSPGGSISCSILDSLSDSLFLVLCLQLCLIRGNERSNIV